MLCHLPRLLQFSSSPAQYVCFGVGMKCLDCVALLVTDPPCVNFTTLLNIANCQPTTKHCFTFYTDAELRNLKSVLDF